MGGFSNRFDVSRGGDIGAGGGGAFVGSSSSFFAALSIMRLGLKVSFMQSGSKEAASERRNAMPQASRRG
jgi:hypothetical protein